MNHPKCVLYLCGLLLVAMCVDGERRPSEAKAQVTVVSAAPEVIPDPPFDVELSTIDGVSIERLSEAALADGRQGIVLIHSWQSFAWTGGRLVDILQAVVPDDVYVLDDGRLPEGPYDVAARTGGYENAIIWALQDAFGVTFGVAQGQRPVHELVRIEGHPLALPPAKDGDETFGDVSIALGKTVTLRHHAEGTWDIAEQLSRIMGVRVLDQTNVMGLYTYRLELKFDRPVKEVMALPLRVRRPIMRKAIDKALQPFGLSCRKRMVPAQIVTYHAGSLPEGVRSLAPPSIPSPSAGEELSTVPDVSIIRIPTERKHRISVDPDHNKQLPLERVGILEALRVLLGPDVWVPRHSPAPAGRYDIVVADHVAPDEATALAISAIEDLVGAKIEVQRRNVPGLEMVLMDDVTISLPPDRSEGALSYKHDWRINPSMYHFKRATLDDLGSLMQWQLRQRVANRTGLDSRYQFSIPINAEAPMMTAKFLRPYGIDLRRAEVATDTAVFVRRGEP